MRTKAYPYYIGVALIAGLILLIGVSAVSNKKPAVDQKLAKQAALLQEKQTLLKSQQEVANAKTQHLNDLKKRLQEHITAKANAQKNMIKTMMLADAALKESRKSKNLAASSKVAKTKDATLARATKAQDLANSMAEELMNARRTIDMEQSQIMSLQQEIRIAQQEQQDAVRLASATSSELKAVEKEHNKLANRTTKKRIAGKSNRSSN
jgi:hypothetical protein